MKPLSITLDYDHYLALTANYDRTQPRILLPDRLTIVLYLDIINIEGIKYKIEDTRRNPMEETTTILYKKISPND